MFSWRCASPSWGWSLNILLPVLKGAWHEIFDFRFFFINQCPPGPQVFHWGRFECFRKFAEIIANECLLPVSLTPATSCSAVSTTPAKKFMTPAINLVADFQCSPVSLIPAINLSLVSVSLAINLSPVSLSPAINLSPVTIITGDNDTGDKFIVGDKNKDAMEEGSCQG